MSTNIAFPCGAAVTPMSALVLLDAMAVDGLAHRGEDLDERPRYLFAARGIQYMCCRLALTLLLMLLAVPGCNKKDASATAAFSLFQARQLSGITLSGESNPPRFSLEDLESAVAANGKKLVSTEYDADFLEQHFLSLGASPIACVHSNGTVDLVLARIPFFGTHRLVVMRDKAVSVDQAEHLSYGFTTAFYAVDIGRASDQRASDPYVQNLAVSMGLVRPDESARGEAIVVNPTDTLWIVDSVKTSCGCTRSLVPRGLKLPPHSKVSIPVEIEPAVEPVIHHTMWVGLKNADKDESGSRVGVLSRFEEVSIVGLRPVVATVTPKVLRFGDYVASGKDEDSRRVTLSESSMDQFDVTKVTWDGEGEFSYGVVATEQGGVRVHKIDLSMESTSAMPGKHTGRIEVHTTSVHRPLISIPYAFEVPKDFVVSPSTVRIAVRHANDADFAELRLKGIHGTPVSCTVLDTTGPFTASIDESTDDGTTSIIRVVAGQSIEGIVSGKVRLSVDCSGRSSEVSIPCIAFRQ